jgi:hypothetical protein
MSHPDRYDLARWPHPAPGRAAEETDRLRHGCPAAEEPDEHGRFAETPLVIQVRAAPLPDRAGLVPVLVCLFLCGAITLIALVGRVLGGW